MGRQSNRGKDCASLSSTFTMKEGSGRQILNGQKGPFFVRVLIQKSGHNHQISFQFLVLDYMKSKGQFLRPYLWPVSDIFLGIFCVVGHLLSTISVKNEGLYCILKGIILVIVHQLENRKSLKQFKL